MGFIKRMVTGPDKVKATQEDQAGFIGGYYDGAGAKINNAAGAIGARAPTMIGTGPQDQARAQQMTLGNAVMNRALGQGGPSVAELQMQQGQDAALQSALAASVSRPQGSVAGMQRNLARTVADSSQQVNRDTAMLRAQEQIGAENTAANIVAGSRGQDIGLATSQAQLQVQEKAQQDQLTQQYMAMGLGVEAARQKAAQDWITMKYGIAQNNANRQQQSDGAMIGAVASTVAGAVGK